MWNYDQAIYYNQLLKEGFVDDEIIVESYEDDYIDMDDWESDDYLYE